MACVLIALNPTRDSIGTGQYGLIVRVKDPILDRELETDLLVLSSCMIPIEGTEDLAMMLKVPFC